MPTASPRARSPSCDLPSHPGTPPHGTDEADVGVELSAADVRCAGTSAACPGGLGSDYAGRVLVTTTLRITDRDNDVGAGGGTDPGTVTDVPLEIPAGCTPTAGTQQARRARSRPRSTRCCPGAVKEGDRSIWQTGPVELHDAGPNGTRLWVGVPVELRGRRRAAVHAAGRVHPVVGSRSRQCRQSAVRSNSADCRLPTADTPTYPSSPLRSSRCAGVPGGPRTRCRCPGRSRCSRACRRRRRGSMSSPSPPKTRSLPVSGP